MTLCTVCFARDTPCVSTFKLRERCVDRSACEARQRDNYNARMGRPANQPLSISEEIALRKERAAYPRA